MFIKLAENLDQTDTIILSGEYFTIDSIIQGDQNVTVSFSSRPAATFHHGEFVVVSSPNWSFKISEARAHEILREDCPVEMPYNLLNEEGKRAIREFVIHHAKDKSELSIEYWSDRACDMVNHIYVYPCDVVEFCLPDSATVEGVSVSMNIVKAHHDWYVNYSWNEWLCELQALGVQQGIDVHDLNRWHTYFNNRVLPEDAISAECERNTFLQSDGFGGGTVNLVA